MRIGLPVSVLFSVLVASACSGERGISCEPNQRYANSVSVPPVRVPDDLTPPDESQSLVIPTVPEDPAAEEGSACLETPPRFFEDEG